MNDDDHDTWLREASELLAIARHKPETLELALTQLSRRAFRDFQLSPSLILDYLIISTPGHFEDAGFSDAEIDELVPTIDRIIGKEWGQMTGRESN